MHIVGHRGAKNEAPENTPKGFQHLRTLGIHRVELDVRLSKDDQLVVLHDKTVNRTSNGKGPVHHFMANELFRLNANKACPEWHPQNAIPTLLSVVKAWPELEHIQCEVKTDTPTSLRKITQRLAELITENRLFQQAVVTSSNPRVLEQIKYTNPGIKIGYVAGRFSRNPLKTALKFQCRYLVIHHHRCTPGLIQAAKENGLYISSWTVNSVTKARRLQHWGIHQIITDTPTLMLKQLHNTDYDAH